MGVFELLSWETGHVTQQAHQLGWAAATSSALVVAAVCSILLVAGQAQKPNRVVGSILFGFVIVLVDGVCMMEQPTTYTKHVKHKLTKQKRD